MWKAGGKSYVIQLTTKFDTVQSTRTSLLPAVRKTWCKETENANFGKTHFNEAYNSLANLIYKARISRRQLL